MGPGGEKFDTADIRNLGYSGFGGPGNHAPSQDDKEPPEVMSAENDNFLLATRKRRTAARRTSAKLTEKKVTEWLANLEELEIAAKHIDTAYWLDRERREAKEAEEEAQAQAAAAKAQAAKTGKAAPKRPPKSSAAASKTSKAAPKQPPKSSSATAKTGTSRKFSKYNAN